MILKNILFKLIVIWRYLTISEIMLHHRNIQISHNRKHDSNDAGDLML